MVLTREFVLGRFWLSRLPTRLHAEMREHHEALLLIFAVCGSARSTLCVRLLRRWRRLGYGLTLPSMMMTIQKRLVKTILSDLDIDVRQFHSTPSALRFRCFGGALLLPTV